MKIEIPQSSQLPNHPLTSPVFHSQEYVESFGLYHNNGHPAHAAAIHNGGYHSDIEQHQSNVLNKQKDDTQQNSENVQQNEPNSQVNGSDQSNNTNTNDKGSKSPLSANGTNDNTTKTNARSK